MGPWENVGVDWMDTPVTTTRAPAVMTNAKQHCGRKLGVASKKRTNHHITGLIEKVPEKKSLTPKLNHITRLRECRVKAWYF